MEAKIAVGGLDSEQQLAGDLLCRRRVVDAEADERVVDGLPGGCERVAEAAPALALREDRHVVDDHRDPPVTAPRAGARSRRVLRRVVEQDGVGVDVPRRPIDEDDVHARLKLRNR